MEKRPDFRTNPQKMSDPDQLPHWKRRKSKVSKAQYQSAEKAVEFLRKHRYKPE